MPKIGTAQQTGSKAIRCYDFTTTNSTKRPVTDVHIPIGEDNKTDIPPTGPEGWVGRHDGDGITFETPPPQRPRGPGETRPRPLPAEPIAPGERRRGFTFYLSGPETTTGMYFTFPDSDDTEEGSVEQGGTVVLPQESGTVRPTGIVYCHEITVTAPDKEQIDTVIFVTDADLIYGTTDPGENWIADARNDKDGGTLTAYSRGNEDPIPPGESRVFKLYSKKKTINVDWTALNDGWELVGEGRLTSKFKK